MEVNSLIWDQLVWMQDKVWMREKEHLKLSNRLTGINALHKISVTIQIEIHKF